MKYGILKTSLMLGAFFILPNAAQASDCSAFVDGLNTQYGLPPLSTGIGSGWASVCEGGFSQDAIRTIYQQTYGAKPTATLCTSFVDGLNAQYGQPPLSTGNGSGWESACENGYNQESIRSAYQQAYGNPSTSVAYEFVNASSSGPIVQGFITINPDSITTHQRYVTANVPALRQESSQVTMNGGGNFLIYAKGFITTGSGKDCDSPLTVNAVNYRWPANTTVVATFNHAEDPALFSCTLSLK